MLTITIMIIVYAIVILLLIIWLINFQKAIKMVQEDNNTILIVLRGLQNSINELDSVIRHNKGDMMETYLTNITNTNDKLESIKSLISDIKNNWTIFAKRKEKKSSKSNKKGQKEGTEKHSPVRRIYNKQ